MLYIRTDMNKSIATGHIMRCLSIADAVRELGEDVTFLVADQEPVSFLHDRGYPSIVLHSDWSDPDGELPILLAIIRERGIGILLIDSYQVTEHYLRELQKNVTVCYLDDVNAFDYPVDMLICYANYCGKFDYPSRLQGTKLCLGVEYAPLRAAFCNCPPRQIAGRADRLLLLSGGTDPYHILRRLLEALEGHSPAWEIDVICGGLHQDYEQLLDRYGEREKIHLYRQVADIETYMQRADIAISAGGSTLYELCACGTPAISYSFADNQLENVRQFDEDGLIPCAGDLRMDDVVGNALRLLGELREDSGLRGERSAAMQRLVDGRGALRIAGQLMELLTRVQGEATIEKMQKKGRALL